MIRVIVFLLFVAGFALAAAWLAERPGDVVLTWMGWRIETSLMVALAALATLMVLSLWLWSILRLLLRSPRLLAQHRRERRRRRGQRAVSAGLVAVASGDLRTAQRSAAEAARFAGDAPMTLLLQAQTAQLAGDRAKADAAFRAMTEQPETRLLGLRGLYVEAQRRGDPESGRRYAEEAVRAAPALPWAGQAVLEFRCASGDWNGALTALENQARNGLIDRGQYRRQRAVLLTARALELEDENPEAARTLSQEAAKLAPDLVPAVSLSARLAAENGEWRRAAKLVETAWRQNPHPDLAEIYAHLRAGDTARDRLARMQNLARLRPRDRESALAVARAAIDAHEFVRARAMLAPLLAQPTQRVAMLMAELEEAEHGDVGRAREWMARALRAGGDPRWTADGMVSDRWLPVSPVSGRLDAFEWRAPVAEIGIGGIATEYRAETARPLAPLPIRHEPEAEQPAVAPADEAEAAEPAVAETPAPSAAAPSPPPTPEPMRAAAPAPAPNPGSAAPPRPPTAAPRRGAVIPLLHAPDDPGPGQESDGRPRAGEAGALPARLV